MTVDVAKYDALFGYKMHEVANEYFNSEADIRAIFKGNQGGGTITSMRDIVLRLLGIHPVEKRNRLSDPIRCVSKCKPKNDEDEENQQYVEFMRLMPNEFVKKDLTSRNNHIIIRDPHAGSDNKVEFMSKMQDLDAYMSVQRSAYYQDEEIERVKWDESLIRLLIPGSKGMGGDTTITLTPVKGLDWTYDSIWEKAEKIYRSQTIHNAFGLPRIETKKLTSGIEAFCWATDDNPVMDAETLQRHFDKWDIPGVAAKDNEDLAMRRYGVFRQVSGRIYKSFDENIHKISWDKLWNADTFRYYWHFRMIDYHPSKPWYVSWVAVSPTHEWYVWNELVANHDKLTDLDLRDKIKVESLLDEDDPFCRTTLIDPLAKVKQPNTGFSVYDDITMGELGLRKCTPADTKNEQGQMNIKQRLKNSLICGVPGNNLDKQRQSEARYGNYRPTLWFFDTCPVHIDHFRSWRKVQFKQEHVKAVRTVLRNSEKWSDFPRNLEFLGALSPVYYDTAGSRGDFDSKKFFQGQKRAA
jgi:hypothetical protein